MRLAPSDVLASRHRTIHRAIGQQNLDALVVTNPFNIRYLTNHVGSAGTLIVTRDRLFLLIDFRYQEAVSTLQASAAACPTLHVRPVPASYDEALVDALCDLNLAVVGIEAAHLTVARQEWLARTLAARGSAITLRSTERLVEQLRLIKDTFELSIARDSAARLEAVADQAFATVRAGVSERDVAAAIEGAMPIGILGSLAVCTILYVLFSYVLSGVATVQDFRTAGKEASVAFAISTYMRIEIEDRLARELDVSADESRLERERGQRLPHFLVNHQPVRVVRQRFEQEL